LSAYSTLFRSIACAIDGLLEFFQVMLHVAFGLFQCAGIPFFVTNTIWVFCGAITNGPYTHAIIGSIEPYAFKITDQINTTWADMHFIRSDTQHTGDIIVSGCNQFVSSINLFLGEFATANLSQEIKNMFHGLSPSLSVLKNLGRAPPLPQI